MRRELKIGLSISVVDLFCSALGAAVAWFLVTMAQADTEDGFSGDTAVLEFEVLELPAGKGGAPLPDPTGISVSCEFPGAGRIVRPENGPQSGGGMPFTTVEPSRGGGGRYTVILSGPTRKGDVVRVFLHDWRLSPEHPVRVRVSMQGPRRSEPSRPVVLSREKPCWEMPLDGLTDPSAATAFVPEWREYRDP